MSQAAGDVTNGDISDTFLWTRIEAFEATCDIHVAMLRCCDVVCHRLEVIPNDGGIGEMLRKVDVRL